MNRSWIRGQTRVEWVSGGLLVQFDGRAVLLDAPLGVVSRLGAEVGQVQAIVLSSPRAATIGGLVPVLCAMSRYCAGAVTVVSLTADRRSPQFVEAWLRSFPDSIRVTHDMVQPGLSFSCGPFEVQTMEIRAAEKTHAGVAAVPAVALSVTTPDATIAWLPTGRPSQAMSRAVQGADLAVVEVGQRAWPTTESRWRMSAADATRIGADAAELWLVGDDGFPVAAGEA